MFTKSPGPLVSLLAAVISIAGALGGASACKGGGDDNGEVGPWIIPSAGNNFAVPENLGRPPTGTEYQAAPAGLLECRNGDEPGWALTSGSIPTFYGRLATVGFPFGPLNLNSGVPMGALSGIVDAPAGADRAECGASCALVQDEVLMLHPNRVISVLRGHNEARYAWVAGLDHDPGYWQPDPYVYEDVAPVTKDNTLIDGAMAGDPDFATAASWFLVARNGGFAQFDKFGAVWRIVQTKDAVAAMARAAKEPNAEFMGRTVRYVRSNDADGYLLRVLDYRAAKGVAATIFERDAKHQVTRVAHSLKFADAHGAETGGINDAAERGSLAEMTYTGGVLTSIVQDGYTTGIDYYDATSVTLPGHAPAMVRQIKSVTDPGGTQLNYTYTGAGRLQTMTIPKGAGDKSLAYEYVDCPGAPAGVQAPPCNIKETNGDGFVKVTEFGQFVPGTDRLFTRRHSQAPDFSKAVSYERLPSGYLKSIRYEFTGETTTLSSDAHPANGCSAMRIDGATSAGKDVAAEKVSAFEVSCYDSDNQIIRQVTRDGEVRITYQKEGKAKTDAWWTTLGWSAQIPALKKTTLQGEDEPMEETTTIELAGMKVPGTGAKYKIVTDLKDSQGASVGYFDAQLRAVAEREPEDRDYATTEYDEYGNEKVEWSPTTSTKVARSFYASGNLKTSEMVVCSKNRLSATYEEDSHGNVTSAATTKSTFTVTNTNKFAPKDGALTETFEESPRYKRTTTRKLTPIGSTLIGTTETTTFGQETPFVETWEWKLRGY